jgi:membrane peptidoglycan carboxypeptidase
MKKIKNFLLAPYSNTATMSCFFIAMIIVSVVTILVYPLPKVRGKNNVNAIRNENGAVIGFMPNLEGNAIPFRKADSAMLKLARYVVLREDPYLLKGDIRKRILGISPRFLFGKGGGGSTIPQQFLKNISSNDTFLNTPKRRSVSSKLGEMAGSVILSLRYSPEEILQMYLNNSGFLKGNFIGLIAAAEEQFDVGFSELNDLELYLLARSVKGPVNGGFDFRRINKMPQDSLRNLIADSYRKTLISNNRGTENELQLMLHMPIRFRRRGKHLAGNDYLFSSTKSLLPDSLSKNGVQYISNLEPDKMKAVDEAFALYANENRSILKKGDYVLDAVACIIDTHTAKVIAINSEPLCRILKDTTFSVRNRIAEPVIIGSCMKPLLIADGLSDRLLASNSLLLDQYMGRVHNHDNIYRGWLSFRDAIRYSSNVTLDNSPVRNQLVGGTENKLQQAFGNALRELPFDRNPSQYVIGQSRELNILQLAQFYRAILTSGVVYPAQIYQTALNTAAYPFDTLYKAINEPVQLFESNIGADMQHILTGPFAEGGTLHRASKWIKNLNHSSYYGKTGTSAFYEQGTCVISSDKYLVTINIRYINIRNRKKIMPIPGRSGGASAGRIAAYIFNNLN